MINEDCKNWCRDPGCCLISGRDRCPKSCKDYEDRDDVYCEEEF